MENQVVEKVIEEAPKKFFQLTARDVFFVAVGAAAGYAAKHYRNIYLEWKRKRLGGGFVYFNISFGFSKKIVNFVYEFSKFLGFFL